MIAKRSLSLLLAAAACITSAQAQLPSLDEKIWLGYFLAYAGRDSLFGVNTKGDIRIQLEPSKGKGSNGAGIGSSAMNIIVGVEEEKANSKTTIRAIREESLETKDQASSKFEKAVIRGKVTGDATFELTLERDRGNIIISNRLIDPGKLTTNPVRPVVILRMPPIYKGDKEGELSKVQLKAREKDSLHIKWTDGNRKRLALIEKMDASTKEINGPGIAIAQIEADGIIQERKLTLEAPEGVSVLRIDNSASQALSRGLQFTAMPAPAKPGAKPNDTARMVISVR